MSQGLLYTLDTHDYNTEIANLISGDRQLLVEYRDSVRRPPVLRLTYDRYDSSIVRTMLRKPGSFIHTYFKYTYSLFVS